MFKNNFNLLRLYAAFQVLLQHSCFYLLKKVESQKNDGLIFAINSKMQLFHGVDIFFLISGFLILMSYKKYPKLTHYSKNRLLRIYPALYINILFSLAILYLFGYLSPNSEFFSWLIAQMTLFQFYNSELFRDFGVGVINGSLWTISVELTFYIILPIIVSIHRKWRGLTAIIFVISFIFWIYDRTSDHYIIYNKILHVSILPHLFIFMIGMGFYHYFYLLKEYIEERFLIWFLLYLLFIYIGNISPTLHLSIIYPIIQWLLFPFVIFSFAFSWRELSYKLLKKEDYTYGVYIYHMLIINLFVALGYLGDIKYFIYTILLSFISGVLSWHLIEKPFLKFKKASLFNELKTQKER